MSLEIPIYSNNATFVSEVLDTVTANFFYNMCYLTKFEKLVDLSRLCFNFPYNLYVIDSRETYLREVEPHFRT